MADPKFMVGEPVLIVPAPSEDPRVMAMHGVKTRVTAVANVAGADRPPVWGYRTEAMPEGYRDGVWAWAEPALRPLPGSEPSSWSLCAFRPTEQQVTA